MKKFKVHPKSIDMLTDFPTEKWQEDIIRRTALKTLGLWFAGAFASLAGIMLLLLYVMSIITIDSVRAKFFDDGMMSGIMTFAAFVLMIICLFLVEVETCYQISVRYRALLHPEAVFCRMADITEKQLRFSNDHAGSDHRTAHIFVAARLDEENTIYADCSRDIYEKVIPGQTAGFFYSLDDRKVLVYVLENTKMI